MKLPCKKCEGYYILRKGKYGVFAGCSNFPRCRSTMTLAEYRRLGGDEGNFFEEREAPLPDRFAVFDVETPNSANDRMSAIGLAMIEGGRVTEEFATLVNPETYFHHFNIQLTGITPEAAAEAPTFPELWPTLEPYFTGSVLVAHNATFDLNVLAKCLRDYGIAWQESAPYVCTVRMSRACFPNTPNHKLNTLCDCLGIPLDHHRAGSDASACAQILLRCIEAGGDVRRFCKTFDLRAGKLVRC